jgi:nucleoside-diphosphate-sugar epimerase
MILIVGTSGTLGRVVAQRLMERGEAVRGMSRTPEKIQEVLSAERLEKSRRCENFQKKGE